MNYKIIKKTIGTNAVETLGEIRSIDKIKDIIYTNDYGLVYSAGSNIGRFFEGKNEFPWFTANKNFGFLSGLTYCEQKNEMYFAENAGKSIHSARMFDFDITKYVNGADEIEINRMLKKTDNEAMCLLLSDNYGSLFICFDNIFKCFLYRRGIFHEYAGDGGSRFSVGCSPHNTSIGRISDMSKYKGKIILSSEKQNVVRSIDENEIKVIFGDCKKNTVYRPSLIEIVKNNMYVLCDDKIYSYSFSHNRFNEIPSYESQNIYGITSDKEKFLFLLESVNE